MTKVDPANILIGTRLTPTTDERGAVKVDKHSEWTEGNFQVEAFDRKNGLTVGTVTKTLSRKKYEALREDFDVLSTEEVLAEYFPDLSVGKRTETDLQKEAADSAKQTADREAEVQAAVDAALAKEREEVAAAQKAEKESQKETPVVEKTPEQTPEVTPAATPEDLGTPEKSDKK